ncbi:hypothetical protein OHA98_04140 [Streptomyces sp. NBC_00654]|uniref:hypothetical protein n=1 Tax=Streptomyces sp. NBC_00654 TaxID=2975799 RepID=UPI0022510397|nr:hypothetical protein [Streptomyces sp. NBC_00654]MCX4964022.1 hypothetical protein [Streptomyces sp. NBC_00654]
MSELKRVDEGLEPEVAALAQALRDLFLGIGISTRRYAARRAYDSSTVSRYLGGRRLPPWEFVLNLLNDVAEERGTVPTEQTIGMLRELHTTALRAGNSPVHKMQLLQRQLAEADQEARRAAMRERLLEDTLQDREHRIRDLQMRYRELQAAPAPSAREPGDGGSSGETSEERDRLRAEIHGLQAELGRVRALHRQAEERCEQLERQLTEAEAEAQTTAAQTAAAQTAAAQTAAAQTTAAGRTGGPALVSEALGPSVWSGHTTGNVTSETSRSNNYFEAVHGDVNVVTSGWMVDEEYVDSLTVRVMNEGNGLLGHGLLVDARTVVTFGFGLPSEQQPVPGTVLTVRSGERDVRAVPTEVHVVALQRYPMRVVALRLSDSLPFPERPLFADLRPAPGSQLLVSGYLRDDRYSCLLDVKGRTGESLRVSGEIVKGLAGAPAFSSTGGLAGLVALGNPEKNVGHVLRASALLDLPTVGMSAWARTGD